MILSSSAGVHYRCACTLSASLTTPRERQATLLESPHRTLPTTIVNAGVTLRARCVPGARPHRGRGDQARPARSRFRESPRLGLRALDGRLLEVAVQAGKSL